MRNCLAHVDLSVRRAGRARPDVALRLERIVERVKSLVGDEVVGTVVSVIDGGNCRDHFIDGSGGIRCEQRAVEKRRRFVLAQLGDVFGIGAEVEGRVARAGKHLAGFHLLDHDRAAHGVLALLMFADAVFAQIKDDLLERLLGGRLKRNIDGCLDVVARLGKTRVVLVEHIARRRNRGDFRAGRAVQIFLKRLFDAGRADHGVHGVALLLILRPLVGSHRADGAEQMRGVGGFILADRAGLDDNARNAKLRDRRQRLRVHVLCQHVVFKTRIVDASKLQLVADGDDVIHIVCVPVIRYPVCLAQVPHQRGRGNVEVVVAVVEEHAEIVLPGGVQALHIVFIRLRLRHREVALALDAELLAHLQQL